nr:MAG TPA: hypothetical protein [Caudoviricetes sp.]
MFCSGMLETLKCSLLFHCGNVIDSLMTKLLD